MTRKQALHTAVSVLSRYKKYEEEVKILNQFMDELPLIHWSDASIRDAVEQFQLDHGRTPTVSDFRRKGMPPHTVIKQKYKITLKQWLEENYPAHKPTREELRESYNAAFVKEYERLHPKSQEDFNHRRQKGCKGWNTVANYNGVKTWRQLLTALKLPIYDQRGQRKKIEIRPGTVTLDAESQKIVDTYNEIIRRRIEYAKTGDLEMLLRPL